jgi:hypothetical protein
VISTPSGIQGEFEIEAYDRKITGAKIEVGTGLVPALDRRHATPVSLAPETIRKSGDRSLLLLSFGINRAFV